MRVVYKDTHGIEYSAPVVQHGDKWVMQTADGLLLPIAYIFKDDKAGRLMFSHYREDQPTAPAEPDPRLHIEPKQPGLSSLAQLQSAAAKVEAQARVERQREIQNQVAKADARDAAKVRQARDINNALATRWHTHRDVIPPPQLTNQTIGALAEEARYRKKKIEPQEPQ